MNIPEPTDGSKAINHLYCGTKFQLSRDRFCTESHHMPVPLIFFYDESHLDRNGVLTNAPMFFSIGWFNHYCRARLDFWRILALVPHLGLGSGKSSSKDAMDKAKDHHAVLREVYEELEWVSKKGGLWVTYNGQQRLLKFWIHFIIGDTKGHNQLCGAYEKSTCTVPMRGCMCAGTDLDILPLQCETVTISSLDDAREEEGGLGRLCYRDIDNCYRHLPMGHPTRGIMACCNFEPLHVIDQGIYKYMSDTLWEGMTGHKQDREKFDLLFRAMSRYMERQSETDMARRGCKWELTDDTRFTAMERLGNMICMLVCLHTHDGVALMRKSFEEKRKGWVNDIKDAIESVITFERWILQDDNTADEVTQAAAHVNKSLDLIIEHFPREKGQKWSIPKVHGYIHMYFQVMQDGPGNGWTSQHGERFHKENTNGAASNTQKRHETVCKQMSDRIHENRTLDVAASMLADHISSATVARTFTDTTQQPAPTTRERRSYTRPLQDGVDYVADVTCLGRYTMFVPSAEDVKNKTAKIWRTTWANRIRQKVGVGLADNLKFAVRQYATNRAWTEGFHLTGFTCIKKVDPSTGEMTRYRSDPDFYGRPWQDWCTVHFNEGVCPALILGFVRFDTSGFPTPMQVRHAVGDEVKMTEDHHKKVLEEIIDRKDTRVYVVVRCAEKSLEDLGYDNKFITPFRLLGRESVWIKPIEEIIGPLMVVPSIQTVHYMGESEWLIVRPMRVWGDWFGRKIADTPAKKLELGSKSSKRQRQGIPPPMAPPPEKKGDESNSTTSDSSEDEVQKMRRSRRSYRSRDEDFCEDVADEEMKSSRDGNEIIVKLPKASQKGKTNQSKSNASKGSRSAQKQSEEKTKQGKGPSKKRNAPHTSKKGGASQSKSRSTSRTGRVVDC